MSTRDRRVSSHNSWKHSDPCDRCGETPSMLKKKGSIKSEKNKMSHVKYGERKTIINKSLPSVDGLIILPRGKYSHVDNPAGRVNEIQSSPKWPSCTGPDQGKLCQDEMTLGSGQRNDWDRDDGSTVKERRSQFMSDV